MSIVTDVNINKLYNDLNSIVNSFETFNNSFTSVSKVN